MFHRLVVRRVALPVAAREVLCPSFGSIWHPPIHNFDSLDENRTSVAKGALPAEARNVEFHSWHASVSR